MPKSHDPGIVRSSRLVSGSPVFYGWIIMLAGTLGMIMTSPGQTYCVSIFTEHFIRDLGISRSLVSTLYSAGTFVASLALPMVGRQIDRRGPRQMVVVVAILLGFACVYVGFVGNAFMLFLGFVAIRMLGQGSLGLVSTNVINQWWVRRRGAIMGISGVLTSVLSLGVLPALINRLVAGFGWRATYVIQGLALLLVMAPLGLLLFRNSPEDYGLHPDGGSSGDSAETGSAHFAEEDWERSEAIRTYAFWILAAGVSAIAMLTAGLFFHMVSIFADNGLSPDIAASVFLPIALATAVVTLSGGIMVRWIAVRFLLAIALLLQSITLLMAQFLYGVHIAFMYGVILGATMGLMRTLNSVAWASYFGRRHLGAISGAATMILIAGSALGPMPFGIARDLLGDYNQALSGLAVLPLILAFFTLFAKRPRKPA